MRIERGAAVKRRPAGSAPFSFRLSHARFIVPLPPPFPHPDNLGALSLLISSSIFKLYIPIDKGEITAIRISSRTIENSLNIIALFHNNITLYTSANNIQSVLIDFTRHSSILFLLYSSIRVYFIENIPFAR